MNDINRPSPQNIVFDLGGVMAKISHTWEGAAASAAVACRNLTSGATPFNSFPAFDEYQAGKIDLPLYLEELAQFVGCAPDEALAVHNGILEGEFPGMLELVQVIRGKGLGTGCLSNTNKPHWDVLIFGNDYPAIRSLDMKMASHLVGMNKPSPAIFEAYTETFGLSPDSIVFFDDSPANVAAASACGWIARWIDSSIDTPTQMRAYLIDLGVI